MTSRSFTEIDLNLRDGRTVHIRSIRRSDEDELLQAFARLDPDALYMRFMRVVREANVDRLRSYLASFPGSGSGLVATVPAADGIDIVGVASVFIGHDPTSGEFSITVAADHGGNGLGHALMSALIATAKARGLIEMEGFVLRVNTPMLRLAARLGFTTAADPEDPSVVICRLRLDAPATNERIDKPADSACKTPPTP